MNPILPPRLITISVRTSHQAMESCFGYGVIPGSRGELDTPLHVIALIDSPVYAGSCLSTRVIGMIGSHCLLTVDERSIHPYQSIEEVPSMQLLEIEDFLCEKGWHVYHPRHGVEEACERLALALCRGLEAGRAIPPLYATLS